MGGRGLSPLPFPLSPFLSATISAPHPRSPHAQAPTRRGRSTASGTPKTWFVLLLLVAIVFIGAVFAASPGVTRIRVDVDSLRGRQLVYAIALPPEHSGPLPVVFMPAHPTGQEPELVQVPEVGGPWAVVLVDGWNVFLEGSTSRAYERLCASDRFRKRLRAIQAKALHDALAKYPLDPNRVVCFGVSASGNSCWDLALHWPGTFAGVWPVSAGYHPDPDSPFLGNLEGQHFYVLHGVEDPIIRSEWVDLAVDTARDAGAHVVEVRVPGAGHGVFEDDVWQAGLLWAASRSLDEPAESTMGVGE